MAMLETYGTPIKSHFVNPVFLGSLPIKEGASIDKMMDKERAYFAVHGYDNICFRVANN